MVLAMMDHPQLDHTLVAVTQHGDILTGALATFGLAPDCQASVERTTGTLPELAISVIDCLAPMIDALACDLLVVQGDTLTASIGAQVGIWAGVPIAHLEAGLRSGDLRRPFPEESNRRVVGAVADLHLAPTDDAAANLIREGVDVESVVVCGNTVVDAIQHILTRPVDLRSIGIGMSATDPEVVLVTTHRRESWGEPLAAVARAVAYLADTHPRHLFVLPVHPNPTVREPLTEILGGRANLLVVPPLPYPVFVHVLARSTLVLSDSGGVQEEAPSVGVPTLVLREVTERHEGLRAGVARLVGTDPVRIIDEATRLLNDPVARRAMAAATNPYGDGRAAERVVGAVLHWAGLGPRPTPFVARRSVTD
jgi:UDP-N-acetylglucosamine 2-epimerase (non-hydrolysing)